MDRVISMIMRVLVRKGVNFGINAFSRRGQNQGGDGQNGSQNGGQRRQNGGQGTKGVRQAMRAMRRISRF